MRARNSGMQSLVNNLVKGAFVVGVIGFGLTACTNPSTLIMVCRYCVMKW